MVMTVEVCEIYKSVSLFFRLSCTIIIITHSTKCNFSILSKFEMEI